MTGVQKSVILCDICGYLSELMIKNIAEMIPLRGCLRFI